MILWGLLVLLVLLWILGFALKLTASIAIHVLLLAALVILIVKILIFFRNRGSFEARPFKSPA